MGKKKKRGYYVFKKSIVQKKYYNNISINISYRRLNGEYIG